MERYKYWPPYQSKISISSTLGLLPPTTPFSKPPFRIRYSIRRYAFSLVALSIAFASRQVAAAAIDPASISEDPTSIVSSIASITAFDGDKVPSSYILTVSPRHLLWLCRSLTFSLQLQDTVSKPSFIAQFRSSFPANSTDGPELNAYWVERRYS